MIVGTILKGIGGFYYVKIDNNVVECKPRGIFRKDGTIVLPGDRVLVEMLTPETGSIEKIMDRKNFLVRPAIANIDQVVIVVAARTPPIDYLLLDKLLISVSKKNIEILIGVNKVDLDVDGVGDYIMNMYSLAGYKVLKISAVTKFGINSLEEVLSGKITVFAGQSGVGKSTILNSIMDFNVMETGEMSAKIERGKHTTRHAQLVELKNGGYIADTPGFTSFDIDDVDSASLQFFYPEINDLSGNCRFKGCRHVSEPECAVKEALNLGRVSKQRYERYCTLYNQLKTNEKNRYK